MFKKVCLLGIFVITFAVSSATAFPFIENRNTDNKFIKLEHIIALSHVAHGDIYNAIDKYYKILNHASDDIYANYYLAIIYEGLGKNKYAEKYYKKASKFNISDPKIFHNYASFLAKNGDEKKSLQYLNKALDLSPFDAQILYDIGVIYSNINKNQEAIEYFHLATKADLEFSSAYNNLCYCLALDGHFEKALPHCQKALSLDENSFPTYDSIGYVYWGLKEFDKAIDFFNRALSINNTIGEIYFHLAQAYQAKGEYNLAITNYQLAMKLDKKFKKQSKNNIKICKENLNKKV